MSASVQRPEIWRATDRHLLLGVSHPSDDPTRHRTFELRASYIVASNGWIARVAEQNVNEQRGDWERAAVSGDLALAYPTAAICLGRAVTWVLEAVDRDADEDS